MKCINNLMISGRLVEDPVVRYTKNKIPVVSFQIAVDRDVPAKEGEKPETDFFKCSAWRGIAEFIGKWFTKGRVIILRGRIENRKWTDENGNPRLSMEIVADDAFFGDSQKQQTSPEGQKTVSGGFATPESVSPVAGQNAPAATYQQNAQYGQAGGNRPAAQPENVQPTPAAAEPVPAQATNDLPEFTPVSGFSGGNVTYNSFVVMEDDEEFDF